MSPTFIFEAKRDLNNRQVQIAKNNGVSYRIAIDRFRVNICDTTTSTKSESSYKPVNQEIYSIRARFNTIAPDIGRPPKIVSYRFESRQAINSERAARSFHFRDVDRLSKQSRHNLFPSISLSLLSADGTRTIRVSTRQFRTASDNCEIWLSLTESVKFGE